MNDKTRIARNFHRHAADYDRHVIVQKRVINRLAELVRCHAPVDPRYLLDIGCGTGALLNALQSDFTRSQLVGLDLAYNMAAATRNSLVNGVATVNADAEQLPFRPCSFDLVVSASTLQWVHDLKQALEECRRVLVPGGMLCVAFFGGRTLWELQHSYRQALAQHSTAERGSRLHRFVDADMAARYLSDLGYEQVLVTIETDIEHHPGVAHLLKSIKGIGASTTRSGGGGLGWRRVLGDMERIYCQQFQQGEVIPATYETIYLVARRKAD